MTMKRIPTSWRAWLCSVGALFGFGFASLHAQGESETSNEDSSNEQEMIEELSPFEVSVDGDRGYFATNTISGSRINTALQDMPMPIEVITSEFIEDTGALDLRESLRYSAGVILDSQNDAGAGLDDVPGGVHNGGGATANISNTTIKLRGFVTDNSLRKGFRRQHGSDSINIDRVEVVRGPAALLYGIGNFGGIVNYLPKRPLEVEQTTVSAIVGADSLYRATIDHTAPVGEKFGYRITGAWEDADHWTDWQNRNKWFVAPVFEYEPTSKTKITLDLELGNERVNGIGFQRMRARGDLSLDNAIDQQDRLQKAGFVDFDGIDERTFRLSGPDTFVETDAHNILFEFNQNIVKGVDLLVGYNRSDADAYVRDIVANSYVAMSGPENLRGSITVLPFEAANGDPIFDGEIFNPNVGGDNTVLNDAVLTYAWEDRIVDRTRDEFRAEITAQRSFFLDSEWFNQSHMILLGYSYLESERFTASFRSGAGARASQLYKDPNDFSPIRFGSGILDNGTPDGVSGFDPLLQITQSENIAKNEGLYAVWQGRFLNERITAIAGIRDDTNDQDITDFTFADGAQTGSSMNPSEEQSQTTNQFGLSLEVLPGVTVFGLMSEGLNPNFEGLRDGNGDAIAATLAESREAGVKMNLFDGRFALSTSIYEIDVTGASTLPSWWTPAPAKGRYDPNQATIYNLSGGVIGDFNAAFVENEALWDAAIANGDAFFQDGVPYITVLDANGNDTAAGAAFMDAMYDWARNGRGWPGWMFSGSQNDDGVSNNAAQDWGAGDFDFLASLVSEQRSTGYEIQLLLTPLENWQIVLNYANTQREITSAGTFPQYPYPQDRWAIWYFPDGNWGLQGVPLNEAYGDPTDTSTWTGGPASTNGESLDDTPEHDIGFWTAYNFRTGPLEGLTLGFGGDYQSERAYLTGFTVGGNAVTDSNGNRISLFTDEKLILNAMAKYEFTLFDDNPSNIQINVDNFTDDEDLYGYVYEAGMSWRIFFGTTF